MPVQTATIPAECRIFVVESARPQRDESCDIDDFVSDLEKDQRLKIGISNARKWLEEGFEDSDRGSLRALRLRAGLSQKDLATLIGLKQPNVSAIESGKRRPEYATAQKMAKALNIMVDDVYKAFELA